MTDDGLIEGTLAGDFGWKVTISTQTRRGRAKQHTFAHIHRVGWVPYPVRSRRMLQAARRGERGWLPSAPFLHDYPPSLNADPAALVALADDVPVQAGALTVILDALYFFERPEVDLDDIKVVLSQLGPRLKRFRELPEDARIRGAAPLYREIVRRCSTLGQSD